MVDDEIIYSVATTKVDPSSSSNANHFYAGHNVFMLCNSILPTMVVTDLFEYIICTEASMLGMKSNAKQAFIN